MDWYGLAWAAGWVLVGWIIGHRSRPWTSRGVRWQAFETPEAWFFYLNWDRRRQADRRSIPPTVDRRSSVGRDRELTIRLDRSSLRWSRVVRKVAAGVAESGGGDGAETVA